MTRWPQLDPPIEKYVPECCFVAGRSFIRPFSHLKYRALAPDSVKDTRVVHRNILLSYNFDDLLRDNAARQGADIV